VQNKHRVTGETACRAYGRVRGNRLGGGRFQKSTAGAVSDRRHLYPRPDGILKVEALDVTTRVTAVGAFTSEALLSADELESRKRAYGC